jgi:Mg/Co/Ni transporter MgtE
VWRTVWVLLGACGIGTLIAGVMLGVFGKTLILYLGPGPSLLLTFVTAITVGALLGDYIGKRRGYRPLG